MTDTERENDSGNHPNSLSSESVEGELDDRDTSGNPDDLTKLRAYLDAVIDPRLFPDYLDG